MDIEFKNSKKPVNYEKALKLLEKRVNEVKKGGRELVWFLEHPTTYTAGIRYKKEEILDKSINIVKTNRGGKITLHNPGQKIVYFVLDLNRRKKNIRNLVREIENIIVEFLKVYKIKSYADKKNIGIWVNKKKIAAIFLFLNHIPIFFLSALEFILYNFKNSIIIFSICFTRFLIFFFLLFKLITK